MPFSPRYAKIKAKKGGLTNMEPKRLYRVDNGILAGVCGGIAEYFNIDPGLVRIITAMLILAGGLSLWVYIIAALILPKKSALY